jgi:hypothetical protein
MKVLDHRTIFLERPPRCDAFLHRSSSGNHGNCRLHESVRRPLGGKLEVLLGRASSQERTCSPRAAFPSARRSDPSWSMRTVSSAVQAPCCTDGPQLDGALPLKSRNRTRGQEIRTRCHSLTQLTLRLCLLEVNNQSAKESEWLPRIQPWRAHAVARPSD